MIGPVCWVHFMSCSVGSNLINVFAKATYGSRRILVYYLRLRLVTEYGFYTEKVVSTKNGVLGMKSSILVSFFSTVKKTK